MWLTRLAVADDACLRGTNFISIAMLNDTIDKKLRVKISSARTLSQQLVYFYATIYYMKL